MSLIICNTCHILCFSEFYCCQRKKLNFLTGTIKSSCILFKSSKQWTNSAAWTLQTQNIFRIKELKIQASNFLCWCSYSVEVLDATGLETGSNFRCGNYSSNRVSIAHGFTDGDNVWRHPWNPASNTGLTMLVLIFNATDADQSLKYVPPSHWWWWWLGGGENQRKLENILNFCQLNNNWLRVNSCMPRWFPFYWLHILL